MGAKTDWKNNMTNFYEEINPSRTDKRRNIKLPCMLQAISRITEMMPQYREQYIIEEIKRKTENVAMARIYYKKADDMVAQTWMI